jgi:hypothetical protein
MRRRSVGQSSSFPPSIGSIPHWEDDQIAASSPAEVSITGSKKASRRLLFENLLGTPELLTG